MERVQRSLRKTFGNPSIQLGKAPRSTTAERFRDGRKRRALRIAANSPIASAFQDQIHESELSFEGNLVTLRGDPDIIRDVIQPTTSRGSCR